MRSLVIPDLHGNLELLNALLEEANVPRSKADRSARGVQTIQLGDLANCVYESRSHDAQILAGAPELLDVVLMGNHEYPYFGGPTFSGFEHFADISERLFDLAKQPGPTLKPFLLVGDTLLTHAGVALELAKELNLRTAADAAAMLSRCWRAKDGTQSRIFNQIGPSRRGIYPEQAKAMGLPTCGGVLWSDWSEPRAQFFQVHGHTPQRNGPENRDVGWGFKAINLDIGCGKGSDRIVGLWLDAEGVPAGFVEARL